jgi:hypothetical protein
MPTVTERVEALDALIRRYPSYWPAAWNLANLHVHWSPFLGHSVADARTGLERVVTLNPRFASAWHHLLWIAPLQGDYDRARTALETLERLVDPAEHRWEVNSRRWGRRSRPSNRVEPRPPSGRRRWPM